MVKTYKKKQTKRRRQRQNKRASVRHGRVQRLRKIQRGGADDDVVNIVESIQSDVKSALVTNEIAVDDTDVTLSVDSADHNISCQNNISVTFKIKSKNIKFCIVTLPNSSTQSVYIYLNDKLHGRVMCTVGKNNMGSYHKLVATAIFNAINNKRDFQQYKTK
jgi:hypothetical protein